MKINIIGQVFSTTGYSSHTRSLANALNKIHEVKLITGLIPNWEYQCNDSEMQMIQRPDDTEAVNLIIDLPHNWPMYLNKKKNIGFCVFEGDKVPLSWIDNIKDERVNQVWVPSQHVYEAIKNTMPNPLDWLLLRDKVKIVPHGVDKSIFNPLDKLPNPIFTFLMNKGFRGELDRGGVQFGLKAFIEEFNKGEAKLILKINPAYALPLDQLQAIINKYIQESGKKEIGEINVIYDNLTPKQLNEVYNQCDIFLNPTQSEAFSLPTLEAMGCGKPSISTNYGGHIDFATPKNSWLIDYTLKEVKHDILYEGIKWAQIDIKKLRSCMREAKNEPNKCLSKGVNALETSINWTWKNSSEKAHQYLSQL